MKTMLANMWTTAVGVLAGAIYYIAQNGATMPADKAAWGHLLVGALLAGLGIVAKDATTGSKPV